MLKINITLNKKGLIFIENFTEDSKNDRKYKLKNELNVLIIKL